MDPDAGVVITFKVDGYPFRRENFVLKEIQRVKKLTLESLLVYGPRDYVLCGKETISLADLRGWNILVYIDSLRDSKFYHETDHVLSDHRSSGRTFQAEQSQEAERPSSILGTIFVRGCQVEDDAVVESMPWLVCPFNLDHSTTLQNKIFEEATCDTLVHFGPDGRICALHVQHHLDIYGPDAFPFLFLENDKILREDVMHDSTLYSARLR
ncbi:probable nucleoredoxin 2 [Spinacia oleracea]|uniref:Probable nucleoredoxin 2 n=1 Tax=Spinacia oleracea TaxID=3562 RepID=A0ABM3QZK1_SPIOL|nr:probable nucleoredoxin 2 [Spinacia oleracea]